MKQIVRCVIDRGGSVRLDEVPKPVCNENEILVSNKYSLISIGTEMQMAKMDTAGAVSTTLKDDKMKNTVLNMFKSMKPIDFIRVVKEELTKGYPMGYSGSGEIVEVGSQVEGVNVGDRVSYAGSGHADFVKVPKNLFVKLPESVNYKEGAFVTLGSIAMQGIRQGKLGLGETIVVYGLGLVGLITSQILNAYGFKVIGIDIDDEKIKSARDFGAKNCFNSDIGKDKITEEIYTLTRGHGVDCVIVCAAKMKDSSIVNHAAELCRRNGRIVIVGKVGLDLERKEIYNKELELTISCSYGPGRYDDQYEKKGIDYPYGYVRWTENRNMLEFLDLIDRKKININSFISDIVKINSAEETYKRIQKDLNYNPVGVLIEYNDEKNEERVYSFNNTEKPHSSNKVNIGLIGSGNYSRTMIMPNLNKIEDYNFLALSDNKGAIAKQFGKQYNLNFVTTDYRDLLKNDDIDTIYVATRHDTHKEISLESLKAGKNVICEKPMAMNYEELEELINYVEKSNQKFHVGYNRRYSNFAKKAKLAIKGKSVVTVFINSKKMDNSSWQMDPRLGGGRIIGESCHFFDLINFFINERPTSIFASSINTNNDNIITNNNFTINIAYSNGSFGNIIYTDLGNSKYPKEMITIFSNNNIIEINDFKELKIYGKRQYSKKLRYIDKGYLDQYLALAKNIINNDTENIPTLNDYYLSSVMPLKALDSIKNNQVVTIWLNDYKKII